MSSRQRDSADPGKGRAATLLTVRRCFFITGGPFRERRAKADGVQITVVHQNRAHRRSDSGVLL
jgi:hypothetical protein